MFAPNGKNLEAYSSFVHSSHHDSLASVQCYDEFVWMSFEPTHEIAHA